MTMFASSKPASKLEVSKEVEMPVNKRRMTSITLQQSLPNNINNDGPIEGMLTLKVEDTATQWLEIDKTDAYASAYTGRNISLNFNDSDGTYKEQLIPYVIGYVAMYTNPEVAQAA